MNTVITVGREFGSGGRELGMRLADNLNFKYYDGEILAQIGERTNLSENYVGKIVEGKPRTFYPVTISHTLSMDDYQVTQLKNIYSAQTDTILEMAEKSDCVIVGRCADYILRNSDINLFRIFVYAPMDFRFNRCKERAPEGEAYSDKELKKHIINIDKGRSSYYEDYTLQKWGDKINYDLCINTGSVGSIENFAKHLADMIKAGSYTQAD